MNITNTIFVISNNTKIISIYILNVFDKLRYLIQHIKLKKKIKTIVVVLSLIN